MERQRLTVQVLPSHKQALERIARAEGEPVAVIVRRLIRVAAQKRGLWPLLHGEQWSEAAEHAAKE